MTPRNNVGKGVTGAVRYALSEGKDSATGEYRTEPKGEKTRVAWIGDTGFGFAIDTAADIDLARRVMEFDALNQASKTKPCEKDCVHLSLGWRPGQEPTRAQMEEAAHQALASLGMANARAIFVAHNDEPYAHMHIVASKINPATGRAYDLKGDRITLSKWAEQYERDNGGIVCTRRVEANQLRDAIDRRDADSVLDLMTQQRATFKDRDLERILSKQIKKEAERAQFTEKVLAHPDIVRLADKAGGPTTRYSTRAVLEAEREVLRAAEGLARADRHGVRQTALDTVLSQAQFKDISREQAEALRHVAGAGGLALIDGQAGTGKSFTIDAIRQVYERDGRRVIGLGPTNVIAQDMQAAGFSHAATIHSELFALKNGRTSWNDRTAVILDEAAMIDTKLMAQLTTHAHAAGAKLILVGDDRQLSSIDRGGMFGVLKDKHGAAELAQVRRQNKNDDRRAAELMAEGNFHAALAMYDSKGAIHWTHNQEAARAALVSQWAKDSAATPDKSRFVFAYTNADVDSLNAGLRAVRKERGELGEDHGFQTKHGRADFAERDRIQLTGTDKGRGLINGAAGTIERIDGDRIGVRLDGRGDKRVEFDAKDFQDFRHGYAGTIYKGQGRTLDQTYLYHSEHWRSAASYVALTRHRDKAELFVARDTAEDVKQLARQMARVDDRRAASAFFQSEIAPTGAELPAAAQTAAPARNESMSKYQPLEEAARQAQAAQEFRDGEGRRLEALAKENADRLVSQAETMRQQEKARLAFEAEQKRLAEEGREAAEKEKKRQAENAKAAEAEVRDAGDRYRIALGQHYDVKDPYGSLARASMAEYGAFIRDREKLTQQIAAEKDSEARRALQLRKDIEGNDYMALTSDRIAANSRIITGRRDSEEGVLMRERAEQHAQQAKEQRRELRELAAEREGRNAGPTGAQPSMARPDQQQQPGATPSKPREEDSGKGEKTEAKAEAEAIAKNNALLKNANERADTAARTPGGRGGGGRSGR
jgi:Ti-type conjugative transfer relaxase TraA